MLETIVHKDKVYLGVLCHNPAHRLGALLAHHNHRLGELALNLLGLIAHLQEGVAHAHLNVALGASAVAPRKHSNLILAREPAEQKLHSGSLARSANGNVAHAHNRYLEALASENAHIVEPVANAHACAIQTCGYALQYTHNSLLVLLLKNLSLLVYSSLVLRLLASKIIWRNISGAPQLTT